MMRITVIRAAAITFLIFTMCLAADSVNSPRAEVNESNTSTSAVGELRPRTRIETVTMVTFYLRDGGTVSGKLLSEDKNQVAVELPEESTVIVRSYTTKEIDTRTLTKRPLLEWKYYIELGDYFMARTWDFVDDPDDFIEAIRSYERARQSVLSQGGDSDRLAEIDAMIQKAKQDKQIWTSQVETRAKLKQLEYQAEAENRLKKLEKQIAESNAKLNEGLKAIDKTAGGIQDDYKRLEKAVNGMNKDFVEQIKRIDLRIQELEVYINDLQFRVYLLTRPTP